MVVLLTAMLLSAGCTGTGEINATSAEEAFRQGKALFEEGEYASAVKAFREVSTFGVAGQWAQSAQYFLAKSYLENEQYRLAGQEYTRFLDRYPDASRSEQAEFERALAYYHLSPSYQLDQTPTEQALQYLRLFVNRYPDSEYAERAGEMIDQLTNKLAHKRYNAAQLYERREFYESAAITYEKVLEQYPSSKWADDALLGVMRSYLAYSDQSIQSRRQERLQEALNAYQRFAELFPDSPLMKEAERIHDQIVRKRESLQG